MHEKSESIDCFPPILKSEKSHYKIFRIREKIKKKLDSVERVRLTFACFNIEKIKKSGGLQLAVDKLPGV